MNRLTRGLLAFVAAALWVAWAEGFTLRRNLDGEPLRWAAEAMPIPFAVHLDPGLDETEQVAAIVQAFKTWQRIGGAHVAFHYTGKTERNAPSRDNENVVSWVRRGWGYDAETAAFTTLWVDREGTIVEADVELNAEAFRWATRPDPGRIDVRNVATHEVGHFIGLDHSVAGRTVAMFPVITRGETFKRFLQADDRAGAAALYPAEGPNLTVLRPDALEILATEGAPPQIIDRALDALDAGDLTIVCRVDVDGDRMDELATVREADGALKFDLYPAPEEGAAPRTAIAEDVTEIPSGGAIVDLAAVDIDGDGPEELAVLKDEPAGFVLYIYDTPAPDARPPVARDAWRIPAGENIVALLSLDVDRDGHNDLATLRYMSDGRYFLSVTRPPKRGDDSEAAARLDTWQVSVAMEDVGAFLDAEAADLNSDGVPEIVLLTREGGRDALAIYRIAPDETAGAGDLRATLETTVPLHLEGQRALGLVSLTFSTAGPTPSGAFPALGLITAPVE